jgi:hypothetical protein
MTTTGGTRTGWWPSRRRTVSDNSEPKPAVISRVNHAIPTHGVTEPSTHIPDNGLRRVRAHLRIVYNNAYSRDRDQKRSHGSSSSSSSSTSSSRDRRRRQSVSYGDTRRTTLSYRADPPPRYRDIEWPTSAGSIEYYRNGDDRHAAGTQLARLQRRSSVSYPRDRGRERERERGSERSEEDERGSRGSSLRSKSSSRYEGRRDRRGRESKRWDDEEDDYYDDEETEDEYDEKRRYEKRDGRGTER